MPNPISLRVRGWLYVAGIILGTFVAVFMPDLVAAIGAGEKWETLTTRAIGALTALLSILARTNLSDPTANATVVPVTVVNQRISTADDSQDGTTEGTQGAPVADVQTAADAETAESGTDGDGVDWEPEPAA